jgi:PIN domain nuclease of toxin-antitoxin system
LLLDTHTLYWYVEGDQKLSRTAQSLIMDTTHEVLISPASYWEIAIKVSLGKWALNRPYEEFIDLRGSKLIGDVIQFSAVSS